MNEDLFIYLFIKDHLYIFTGCISLTVRCKMIHITIDVAILTFLTGVARKLPPSWGTVLMKPMEVGLACVRAPPCNLLHFAQAIFLRADNKEMYIKLADAFHNTN